MAKPKDGQDLSEEENLPIDAGMMNRMLMAMLGGLSADKAAVRAGFAPDQIEGAINEARRRLASVADYNQSEQIGTSINRLNDLYSRAILAKDFKSCAAIQKELNKLMNLYRPNASTMGDDGSAEELAEVRQHLLPLGLADETASTVELARLTVAEFVRLRHHEPTLQEQA